MGYGDTPHLLYGNQEDYKKLYYSDPLAALKVPVTLMGGYGVLKVGTGLAQNDSSNSADYQQYFPYNPEAKTGSEKAPGRAYLVQDGADDKEIYVTLTDSYKFNVGDAVDVRDSDTATADLGAITAIDRTTYKHMAKITVTNNCASTYTTAKFAFIVVSGADTCAGILEKSVDTGTGENSQGALATMILGNAVLYTGMLVLIDSAARTDLSASTIGQFTYMR